MKTALKRHRAPVALSLVILSACISLQFPQQEERLSPAVYTLRPSASATTELVRSGGLPETIVGAKPDVPAGLDTDKIAVYFERERRLDYYAGATWSGRLGDLVQNFVIQRGRQKFPKKHFG